MSKIAAVVVTYNRLELLKRAISALRAQSVHPDGIIVVNNGSTDNTEAWLNEQQDLYVIKQENVGGAGGFYTGLKQAYELGYEWIWVMDDDVEADFNCLQALKAEAQKGHFDILQPNRVIDNTKVWKYSTKFNFNNPFQREGLIDIDTVTSYKETKRIVSFPFEGPFIHKNVIAQIGLPDSRFFIWYDDTEYSIRAYKNGLRVGLCYGAILKKASQVSINAVSPKADWKLYYEVRNQIIIDRKYANWYVTILRMLFYNSKRVLKSAHKQVIKNRSISAFSKEFSSVIKGIIGAFKFSLHINK